MIFYRVLRTAWAAGATGVRTLLAQLRGPGVGDAQIPAEDVEVLQPLGVRAKPVVRAGTEACVFELPNGQRVAILVDKTRDEGAVEPADGEVVVGGLAAPAAVVHIKADGSMAITPAAGKDVVLAGGTRKVARVDDAVSIGRLAFAGSGTLTWTPNGGAPQTITAATEITGAVTDGADHVKA